MKRILLSAGNIIRATLLLIFTILAANGAFAQIYTDSSNIGCGIALPTNGSATLTINNVPPPADDATLTMYYKGDLDGGVSGNEIFTLFDENNVQIGISDAAGQCDAFYSSKSFTIPVADVAIWAADGVMEFTVTPGSGVNTGTCTDHCAYLIIEYPSVTAPNNAGVRSLDAPVDFCAGLQNIKVTIVNAGTNIINSVTVKWEFQGVAQTPIVHNSPIDTFGGANPYTAQINLGTKNFQNGILKSIKVWTHKPNGQNDTVNVNDTILRMVQPSLMGTFTIGGGSADYADFKSAVDDLNSFGVCGPVIFNVNSGSGPFNEQLKLGSITGASAVNTITFNGNGESLEPQNTTTNERAAIAMDNAAYFRFQNLIIDVSKATTYNWGVHLSGGSHHNQFSSCDIISSSTNTSSANAIGILISGSNTSTTAAGDASDNSFINNRIIGGYYGVRFNGATGSLNCKNNVLINNQILDFYYYGIYLDDTDGTIIEGNDISRMTRANANGSFYGVSMNGGVINTLFSKNRIHHSHEATTNLTGTAYPIYTSNADAPKGLENIIVNNIIDHIEFNGAIYGIYNNSSDGTYSYHNTISLDDVNATGGITRAIYQTSVADNIKFYNNTISITRGGSGIKHGFYFNTATTSIETDYNIVYMNSAGTGAQHFGYLGSDHTTLSDWQAVNAGLYDQNSFDSNPQFANMANGDFTITNQVLNNTGLDLGVTDDFNNNSRCAVPDIGAVENRLFIHANDAGILSIDEPKSFCPGIKNVVVTLQNYAAAPLNSATINWSINGTPQTPVSFNTPLDTFCGFTSTSAQVTLGSSNFVTGQLYVIRAWTVNPNGVADQNPLNDTSEVTVSPALGGTFTIGGVSPDFNKFNDAVNALNERGVCAPVVFNVRNGSYSEQISIRSISGISNVNTVTFQSESGDSSKVNLNFTAVNSAENYVIQLNNASFITFNKIKIWARSSSWGIGISVIGNSHDNSFTNCLIEGPEQGSTSSNLSNVFSNAGINDNTVFRNNHLKGGSYGFYWWGSTQTNLESGTVIEGNIIEPYYMGMYLYYQNAPQVLNNHITSNTFATYNNFYAMYCFYLDNGSKLIGNRIDCKTGGYGLYMSNCDGMPGDELTVANNFFHVGGTGTAYGIYTTGSTGEAFIVYNSINITSTNTSSGRGLYKISSGANLRLHNNIFANNGDGFAAYFSNTTGIIQDYNNYFTTGATLAYYNLNIFDIQGLQTASQQEANSIQQDPVYFSNTELYPIFTVNDLGTPIASISTDIDMNSRSNTTPDIGAVEFTPPSVDLSIMEVIKPVSGCELTDIEPVKVAFRNFGTATLLPGQAFTLRYRIDNGPNLSENVILWDTMKPLDSLHYDYFTFADLSVPKSYEVKASVVINGDGNPVNNSATKGVTSSYVNNFPVIEDFELWGPKNNSPNCAGGEITELNGWSEDPTLSGRWNVWSGQTPNFGTGPSFDFNPGTNNGIYLYTESTSPCNSGAEYGLISPCVDISNLNSPGLNFGYHMFGTSVGEIHVDVITKQSVFTDIWVASGDKGDQWNTAIIKLDAYANFGVVNIRIRVVTAGTSSDIAIDDVRIGSLPNVDIGNNVSGCGFVNLDAKLDNAKYLWSTGERSKKITLVATNVTTVNIYWVRVNKDGMYNNDSVVVVLSPGPYINLGEDEMHCDLDSLILDAGNPGMSYKWDNGLIIRKRTVKQSGTYFVNVDNNQGCDHSDTVTLVLEKFPVATFGHTDNTPAPVVFFNSIGSHGDTYDWDFGDGIGSTLENPAHYFINQATYTVTLITSNICGSDTATAIVNVIQTGINDPEVFESFSIYPNPSDGNMTIDMVINKNSDWNLEIIDISGRVAYSSMLNNVSGAYTDQLSLNDLPKGTYLLKMKSDEGMLIRQLVIQ